MGISEETLEQAPAQEARLNGKAVGSRVVAFQAVSPKPVFENILTTDIRQNRSNRTKLAKHE